MKGNGTYFNNSPKYNKDLILNQYNNGERLEFLLFFGASKGTLNEGCLSQWQKSNFTVNNIEYSCTEQFMMACKAELFNDLDAIKKILNNNNPKSIKALGRKIKKFDENTWNENKYSIVLKGNYYKFNQNENMKKILIDTKNKVLVEASPYDKIWGVGLSENDEKINNPNNWKGDNLLGFALMEVRDMIK